MKEIRMVDLEGQYQELRDEINAAIQSVIDSTAFIKGPDVHAFEEELATYMNVKHCVACGNGTDALQVAMMALGLEPGDEVITTPFTFIATIEVIKLLRLTPVLADIDPRTFNIDPDSIERAISPRTRAIVPVHLFGQAADMQRIAEIADRNGLYVIEDNAQATGADFTWPDGRKQKTGTIGTIGSTSFFPSKNLGAYGDGGAMFTNDDALGGMLRSMVNHGMTKRYYYEHVGVNSRLDTIQAAILRVKLKHLDRYNAARQEVAAAYDKAFSIIPGLDIPARNSDSTHIFHQYTLRVADGRRDALKAFLEARGIPAMVYYPVPLHLQEAYSDLGYAEGDFPVTEQACKEVLSLPIHTEMDGEQVSYITGTVNAFFKS